MSHKIYIALIVLVFAALTIVFDTFPRSTVSELEKRRLKQFPEFSLDRLKDGTLTEEISSWFSDSEPFRDELMALSMQVKDLMRLSLAETVTFHAAKADGVVQDGEVQPEDGEQGMAEYVNRLNADEEAKIAHAGIIIVGKVPMVRALMAYGGGADGGGEFAQAVNLYKQTFPKVNVYAMVIPIPVEFYCPDQARKRVKPQRPTILNIHSLLDKDVKAVDAYTPLARHAAEDIYMRTDHHWSSLGAYYAASAFAKTAKVTFPTLETGYQRHVVHGYVGSMYGYSHDIAVKQSPEDFVFYTPKDSSYTTTYTDYQLSDGHVVGEGGTAKGPLFYSFPNGSHHTFGTYLGGDARLTKIVTHAKTNRRLLIIKDSFGNVLPGFMTYSFAEVHVVDFRYFTKNMRQYVADNHITDILIAFNMFNAYSSSANKRIQQFLEQKEGQKEPNPTKKPKHRSESLPFGGRLEEAKEKRQAPPEPAEPAKEAEAPQPVLEIGTKE